jgi:hypothetical protein
MKTVLIAALYCSTFNAADAAYILDTGPGQNTSTGMPVYNTSNINGDFQFLAVPFTLASAYTVTGAQGWFWHGDPQTSHVTFVIYGGGGQVPDVNDELFSAVAGISSSSAAQWSGLTGLNWNLGPGTYWLAFEVLQPELQASIMPSGEPNPQPVTAYYEGGNEAYGWLPGANHIGVEIEGSAVPEPTIALQLLAAGVLMFGRHYVKRIKVRS